MPTMDIKLGFHQIAKFNYFPGWHQLVSCSEIEINKKAWDALPDTYKAMIEVAGQAQVIYTYAETEATQFDCYSPVQDDDIVYAMRNHGSGTMSAHHILGVEKLPRVRLFADESGT